MSDRCKAAIKEVDPKNIVDNLMFSDEYRG